MAFFQWNPSNAVFVRQIDDEHKDIFRLAGDLQEAIDRGASLLRIQEALRCLAERVDRHFAHEERLMRVARYEALAWHKQQHDTVRRRLRELAPRIDQGDADAAKALVGFLAKWLDDHTGLSDRMMAAFLRNQQRAQAS